MEDDVEVISTGFFFFVIEVRQVFIPGKCIIVQFVVPETKPRLLKALLKLSNFIEAF